MITSSYLYRTSKANCDFFQVGIDESKLTIKLIYLLQSHLGMAKCL